jgi:hypothetical protein
MKSALVLALITSLATPSAALAAPQRTKLWSEIRSFKPGTEVTLRTARPELNRRYFINANDEAINFLNLSDPSLPSDIGKLLLRAIEEHPYYFPPPQGETVTLDRGVTLSEDGLFVAGQKVANYDVFVERTARADVENGTIRLELKPSMKTPTKILIGVAIFCGSVILGLGIACATEPKGCA